MEFLRAGLPQNTSFRRYFPFPASGLLRKIWKYRYLYLLGLPGMLIIFVFSFLPMAWAVTAFQDYSFARGILGSTWVGLANFSSLIANPSFWLVLRNTLTLSLLGLVFIFPAPILLAVLIHSLRFSRLGAFFKAVFYLPHFLSWVIIASLTYFLLANNIGLINKILAWSGLSRIPFLVREDLFYPTMILQSAWKEVGWSAMIYLSVISEIDPALYDAALTDGAGRWARMVHVIAPAILPTAIVLLILYLGNFLSANLEQVWLQQNVVNLEHSELIDTYIYKIGLRLGSFSAAAALGLCKSALALGLVACANWLAWKSGREGLW